MNEADIPQLYTETRVRLVKLAEAYGAGNKAEDVVQTVFLTLIEVHGKVDRPLGWLLAQTKFATRTLWRREQRFLPLVDDLPEDDDGPRMETPDPRATSSQEALTREAAVLVQAHLERLTTGERELLAGLAEGTVKRSKIARLVTSTGKALAVARR